MQGIKFVTRDKTNFIKILNKRVNNYFKENNIKKTGNWKLYTKAIVMFSLFLVPLIVLLTIDLPSWAQLIMCIIIGIGMAGVGMNIMHDANHESFSSKKWVNNIKIGRAHV